MKKVLAVLMILTLTLAFLPAGAAAHTKDEPFTTDLIAGQNIDVGEVQVWNEGQYLYVRYLVDEEGWCLTETHLDVATSLDEIPQNNGNPVPGHFEYSQEHDCVTQYTYKVPVTWDVGTELYIAAHAVVEEVLISAPYPAASVYDYDQGTRKNGDPVAEAQSNPEAVLELEYGREHSNFFSLGFDGWIAVEFDCPITNGEGNDVQIVEDTWTTTYPEEKAEIYASMDGNNWIFLGEATNKQNQDTAQHWVSEFDLGDLPEAKYIKVKDTTDPSIHGETHDAFDLNAVLSLQDCVREETAWGDGLDFPGANWATYFTYYVQCPYDPGLVNGGFQTPDVTHSAGWNIFDSGTEGLGWTVEWAGDYTDAPDPAHLEIHTSGTVVGAHEGDQYAELDTDWDGPDGSLNGEPASVKIYQVLDTCPGQTYTLKYAWRGRPGYESAMDVSFGDYSASHSDNSGQWNVVEVTVTADEWTETLAFIETGPADSFGMFLDDVSVVKCDTCGP